MRFEDLKNPELQEKLKAAKTADELVALAKEEGFELSDAELKSMAGGWCDLCSTDGPCSAPYWI